MENNIPLASKKVWNIVRAVLFMLRKGICKKKLMVDLNMMLKRGKIAGKAIGNLMFHHGHHHGSRVSSASSGRHLGPLEYEFSCSNSPANPQNPNNNNYFFFPNSLHHLGKHKKSSGGGLFGTCMNVPLTSHDDEDDVVQVSGFQLDRAVIEFLSGYNNNNHAADVAPAVVEASPMLPGFGRTPLVRQLRITDSPFPLKSEEDDDDNYVDKAAEEFIEKFYKELRRQY